MLPKVVQLKNVGSRERNGGMVENWNVGKKHAILLLDARGYFNPTIPIFQHSIIP
ncbi:hypothetical protein D1AOALGA4SA_4448 [Olavius algarvensis Delta 1 endosymbiont]|nr:hypothetical protein D1AOALGA4SA_4448 [Olavius algarvensis Delta 1 endosymbiont]